MIQPMTIMGTKRRYFEYKPTSETTLIKLDMLLDFILDYFEIDRSKILEKSRKKDVVLAKKYFCYFAMDKKLINVKLREVADRLHFTNHSSVLNLKDVIIDDLELYEKSKMNKDTYRIVTKLKPLVYELLN